MKEKTDDLKETNEGQQKEIDELKNRPVGAAPIEMPEIKGDGLELNQLM